MTRLRVFQVRLGATFVALLLVLGVTRLLWYPGGYFGISGAGKLLLVLALIAVVVGPGL